MIMSTNAETKQTILSHGHSFTESRDERQHILSTFHNRKTTYTFLHAITESQHIHSTCHNRANDRFSQTILRAKRRYILQELRMVDMNCRTSIH